MPDELVRFRGIGELVWNLNIVQVVVGSRDNADSRFGPRTALPRSSPNGAATVFLTRPRHNGNGFAGLGYDGHLHQPVGAWR